MDRGRNLDALEALEEEDDEEEIDSGRKPGVGGSDSDSDSDDEELDPAARREPNRFDNLCDGVLNSVALVQVSLKELLDLKDEMLRHALPPTLLIKLATISGKLFRSICDMGMPVNELVRLVRVYSTPWEEKSTALKKLHEDYESKQRQLNIAIKRLQLVDAHSKRIAKEKRIMNWEKLFSKVMGNKGHGRRWKFLIETIKQKAKLGLEHVQEYTKALEESSEEEEEEEEEEEDIPLQMKRQEQDSDKLSDLEEGEEDEGGGEEEAEKSEADEDEAEGATDVEGQDGSDENAEDTRDGSGSKKVRFADEEKDKGPKTKEVNVWTAEPEYDRFLFMRMYTPIEMTQRELKCLIKFGDQSYKTSRLDPEVAPPPPEEPKKAPKGLIGSKGKAQEEPTKGNKKDKNKKKKEEPKTKMDLSRFEELCFPLPEAVAEGIWSKEADKSYDFNVSILSGPNEEMVAMATIDLEDILALEPKEVYLAEPHGDDNVPTTPRPAATSDVGDFDSLSEDMDIFLPDDKTKKKDKDPASRLPDPPKENPVKDVDHTPFPLFSTNPDLDADVHKPCGHLPLVMYIGLRLKPKIFNRQVGTMGISQLVYDLTGIELDAWDKAYLKEIFKDSRSQACSARPITPPPPPKIPTPPPPKEPTPPPPKEPTPTPSPVKEPSPTPPPPSPPKPVKEPTPVPTEEMVPKEEYDKLIEKVTYIQEEYERRLQELTESLQTMEETRYQMQQQIQQQQLMQQQQSRQSPAVRPVSQASRRSGDSTRRAPQPVAKPEETMAETPEKVPVPPRTSPTSRPETAPEEGVTFHPPVPPTQHQPQQKVPKPRPKPPPPQVWGPEVPENFLDRLQWFEEHSNKHKEAIMEKISRQIREDIERKLAGQHKLSKKEEEAYDALRDVSLPALFMPTKRNTIFNPRAHQYFHPTGSSDMRLTQPPSMLQLPPLSNKSKMSVLNLFDLSRNFQNRGQAWLMERYITQQEPLANLHGTLPHTPAPTSANQAFSDGTSALQDTQHSTQGTGNQEREIEMDI